MERKRWRARSFGKENARILLNNASRQRPFLDIGVTGSDVLGTTARFFTSWILVPLQKLGGRGMPRDGADVCNSTAWEGSQ